MPTYTANGVTITSPRDLSPQEIASAFAHASAPKAPASDAAPKKESTPRAGEIPVLGKAVRDVNARESFGWATPLMTAIVPETYPELAAMLGLTLLGGPLAGAAGKGLTNAPKLAKWGGEALSRVASAAVPAAATGAVTGQGATTPGVGAGVGQAAVEAVIPAARALPGVSHALASRAARLDAGKLAAELGELVPAWKPLLQGKKDVQGLFDVLVGAEGQRAPGAAYRAARDQVFTSAAKIDSPSLVAYLDLKAATPGAARFREAANALRQAQRGGAPSMSPTIARELFDELEKDAMLAAKRITTDPRAGDMLNLVNAARTEIARSVPGAGDAMLTAWTQRGLGSKVLDFFTDAKAVGSGVFGPKYNAVKAQQYLGTPAGAEQLSGLEGVANIVNRGKPGVAEGWAGARGSTGIPIGRINVPLPLSARSPGYTPGSAGLATEAMAQPSFQRAAEAVAE